MGQWTLLTSITCKVRVSINIYCSQVRFPVCIVLKSVLLLLQFTFGYGVGGEYPMAAGSAAERAEAKGRASARKRGREVLTALMLLRLMCWGANHCNTGAFPWFTCFQVL